MKTKTQVTLTISDELFRRAQRLADVLERDVEDILAESIKLESIAMDVEERPEMRVEREAFLALHPELLRKFPGEYVAIHDGVLVDHDPSLGLLASRVRRDYENLFVLIRQVLATPEIVYQFRAPKLIVSS